MEQTAKKRMVAELGVYDAYLDKGWIDSATRSVSLESRKILHFAEIKISVLVLKYTKKGIQQLLLYQIGA